MLETAATRISSVPSFSTSPATISVVNAVPDPVTFEEFASLENVPVKALPNLSVILPEPILYQKGVPVEVVGLWKLISFNLSVESLSSSNI